MLSLAVVVRSVQRLSMVFRFQFFIDACNEFFWHSFFIHFVRRGFLGTDFLERFYWFYIFVVFFCFVFIVSRHVESSQCGCVDRCLFICLLSVSVGLMWVMVIVAMGVVLGVCAGVVWVVFQWA